MIQEMTVQYFDVSELSIQETQSLVKNAKESYRIRRDIINHQLEAEMARRKGLCNQSKDHPTRLVYIDNQQVQIDEDMVPVINWFISLGIKTLYCCQGSIHRPDQEALDQKPALNRKPYVLWHCQDQETVRYVIKKFTEFHEHSATQNVRYMFHEVTTKLDYFNDDLRYSSKWYDNLALKDFIQWARI
jgi:hypothetical protein